MTGMEVKQMLDSAKKENKSVTFWRVADALGISAETLSRKLRHDWTPEQVEEIRQAVAQVKAENNMQL